ncbi:MAG TPA: S9 family peptidase, partial [Rhodanobacteraceae bacterium]|nr:S9 family peptidase [Rhodanobacteraceae bacterium]
MGSMIASLSRAGCAVSLAALSFAAVAQTHRLTAHDYARAESFLRDATTPLVDHDVQRVKWLDASHFFYLDHDSTGDHYKVMDAASGKAAPAFDQTRLAAALAKASGKPVKADKLGIFDYDL